jgi:hypothetical protein
MKLVYKKAPPNQSLELIAIGAAQFFTLDIIKP